MKKDWTIFLDEKTCARLIQLCGDDPEAAREFIVQAVKEKLGDIPEKEAPGKNLNVDGLKEYLDSGKPGSRSYGAKGQGW